MTKEVNKDDQALSTLVPFFVSYMCRFDSKFTLKRSVILTKTCFELLIMASNLGEYMINHLYSKSYKNSSNVAILLNV